MIQSRQELLGGQKTYSITTSTLLEKKKKRLKMVNLPDQRTDLSSLYTKLRTANSSKTYGHVNSLFQWLSILIIPVLMVLVVMLSLSPDFTNLRDVCTFLTALLIVWGINSLLIRFLNGFRSGT